MKKKSILLTCICALMALAMFVGCDNAPVIPSFVVGGNVVSGDFLVGQTFDPGKFSITVNYDNGKRVTDDATAKVVFGGAEDGKVAIGDTATVFYGNDYLGEPVTEEVALNVYTIKSLAVTAPEVNGEAASKLRPEDITVVATYLDSDNAEKTMTLTSTEYTIDTEINYVGNEPSSAEPQVQAYYNVIPQVGVPADAAKPYGKLYFTAEFEPSKVYTADDILEIVSIEPKDSLKLYAFDYDYIPRPAFEDVTINVKFKGVDYSEEKESDVLAENVEGLELMFVQDDLPLETGKLVGETNLDVRAVLGNLRAESETSVTLETITVDITAAKVGALDYKPVKGEALPVIDPADFIVTYTDNGDGIKDYVSEPTFVYSTTGKTFTEITDTKVPSVGATNLFVFAKYNGVVSETSVNVGAIDEPTPAPVLDSIELKFATGFEYPAKMKEYNAVPALSASDVVVTASYTVDGETAEELDKTVTPSKVGYSTTTGSVTEATATSFAGTDSLYVYVAYTEGTGDAAVTKYAYSEDIKDSLATAYPTDLEVSFEYETMNAAKTEPMVGSKLAGFVVNAVNADGVVSTLENGYTFIKNGDDETVETDSITVGKEAVDYQVYALVETSKGVKEFITSDPVTVEAGLGYIAEDALSALEFGLASGYDNRVGQTISNRAADYTVKIADASVETTVFEGYDGKPEVKIESVSVVSDKNIEETGNQVIFTVSYVDAQGVKQTKQIQSYDSDDTWTFAGVSGVELSGEDIKVLYDGSAFDGTVDPYTTYTVAKFTLDESSYTVYGEAKPVLQVLKNGSAVSDETIKPGWHTEAGYSVKVTYTALSKNAETGLYEAAEQETVVEIPMNGRA